jgi:CBS domain containing-hemolysin-like protein
MKRLYRILIIFVFLSFIESDSLIDVHAKYDPITNTLIFKGNKYIISEINSLAKTYQPKLETKSFKKEEESGDSFFDGFWFNFIGFTVLACFAGAMSGLTVGYLSIDMLILEIKLNSGTEQEKIYANKIKKIIADHHWILVTLLLCNAFACEAMPLLLDKLVNEMMAIVVSVTVLLFVGEIVPQALCTGPNQMKIAAFLAPFTYSLMIITYPLSYPIAKFMDCVVGLHGKTRFCNSDLKSVIELHVKEFKGNLTPQQMGYFTGFLDIMNKKVGELMLPIEKAFKLDYEYKIDKINLEKLVDTGYSRIPIYEGDYTNLVGILRIKDLVGVDTQNPKTINELAINLGNAIHASENTFFLDLFEKFKKGKSKMAFIHKDIKDEKLLPEIEVEEEKVLKKVDEKDKENNIIEVKDPLLDHNREKINKKDKKLDAQEEEKNIKNNPVVGILTLEDLIETWLQIHILDEENDEENLIKSRRKITM